MARSWADLLALLDRLHDVLLWSRGWVSCGPDPRINTVTIELQQADPALIEQLLTIIPGAAISVSIDPGARFIRPGRGSGP